MKALESANKLTALVVVLTFIFSPMPIGFAESTTLVDQINGQNVPVVDPNHPNVNPDLAKHMEPVKSLPPVSIPKFDPSEDKCIFPPPTNQPAEELPVGKSEVHAKGLLAKQMPGLDLSGAVISTRTVESMDLLRAGMKVPENFKAYHYVEIRVGDLIFSYLGGIDQKTNASMAISTQVNDNNISIMTEVSGTEREEAKNKLQNDPAYKTSFTESLVCVRAPCVQPDHPKTTAIYYNTRGEKIGSRVYFDEKVTSESSAWYDAAGKEITPEPTLGEPVPAELSERATAVLGQRPASMQTHTTATPCAVAADGSTSSCFSATDHQFLDADGKFIGGMVKQEQDGKITETWRDANGNPILENTNLPPAVAAYVDDLQKQVGTGFKVTTERQIDGNYRVRVARDFNCPAGAACMSPAPGSFSFLEFNLDKNGALDRKSITANYITDGLVDGTLLFNALKQEPALKGIAILTPLSDRYLLIQMTKIRITQVDKSGAIYFEKNDENYKAYRDASGNVVLEKDIPTAVQNHIADLKKALGDAFTIWAILNDSKPNKYIIKIELKDSTNTWSGTGKFVALKYAVTADGAYVSGSANAYYQDYSWSEILKYDLLFDAARLLSRNTVGAAVAMSKFVINSVDSDGAIHFQFADQFYKVARGANAQPVLTKEPSPDAIRVQETVFNDLINTFGFSKAALDQLIKDGKVKIEVNLKNLTAKVTIDPSVTLPGNSANLIDLLGSNKLPAEINFVLGKQEPVMMGAPCSVSENGVTDCPPAQPPTYYLLSGSFKVETLVFGLSYMPKLDPSMHFPRMPFAGDNRLTSVTVTEVNDPCANSSGPIKCMAMVSIRPIKDIAFTYADKSQNIKAHIVYHDGSQGAVISRDVTLVRMGDGQQHIQTIVDMDKNGKVLAKSNFVYDFLTTYCEAPCVNKTGVRLNQIIRTDANGKPLSTISGIHKMPVGGIRFESNSYAGTQTLPDGTTLKLTFMNFEEMLAQALENEHGNVLKEITKQIQAKLAEIFGDEKVNFVPTEKLYISPYNPQYGVIIGKLNDKNGNALIAHYEINLPLDTSKNWQVAPYDPLVEGRLAVPAENYAGLLAQLGDPSHSPLVLEMAINTNPDAVGIGGEAVVQHLYHFRAIREGRIELRYTESISSFGMDMLFNVLMTRGLIKDAKLSDLEAIDNQNNGAETSLVFQIGKIPAVQEAGVIYLEIGQAYDVTLFQGGAGVEVPRHSYTWPLKPKTKKPVIEAQPVLPPTIKPTSFRKDMLAFSPAVSSGSKTATVAFPTTAKKKKIRTK